MSEATAVIEVLTALAWLGVPVIILVLLLKRS